jgi:hypothetical protein
MVLEPDRWSYISDALDISALDRIYPTWSQCEGSGTRLEAGYVKYIRYVRSRLGISGLEPVPRFWNLMKISDLVRYIQYNRVLPNFVINIAAAFFAASRSSHRQQPWGDLSLPPFAFLSLLIVFPMILIIKDKLLFIPFKENGK